MPLWCHWIFMTAMLHLSMKSTGKSQLKKKQSEYYRVVEECHLAHLVIVTTSRMRDEKTEWGWWRDMGSVFLLLMMLSVVPLDKYAAGHGKMGFPNPQPTCSLLIKRSSFKCKQEWSALQLTLRLTCISIFLQLLDNCGTTNFAVLLTKSGYFSANIHCFMQPLVPPAQAAWLPGGT